MTFGLSLFLLLAQVASSDAASHIQAGVEAERQHQFDTAIAEFRKATEIAPSDPGGFVGIGQTYMQAARYGDAVPALQHALELQPDLQGAHQLLGYALLVQGYAAEATPHLEKANDRGALGIAQVETNSFADAVANLSAALAQKPSDPDLIYYLGRASQMLANESNEKLLASFPQSARAHQLKAQNYLVLHDIKHAEEEYRAVLATRADLPGIHLELGELFVESSRLPLAEKEFRQERKDRPGSGEAAYRLGHVLLRQGKLNEAVQALEASDELAPDMPETLSDLGEAALQSGDAGSSEKSWTRLLAIEPTGPLAARAHFGLASVYRGQGKPAQAETEMQEFKRLSRPNP